MACCQGVFAFEFQMTVFIGNSHFIRQFKSVDYQVKQVSCPHVAASKITTCNEFCQLSVVGERFYRKQLAIRSRFGADFVQ